MITATYVGGDEPLPEPVQRTRLRELLDEGPNYACNKCGSLCAGEEGVYLFERLPELVQCGGVCSNLRQLTRDEQINLALDLWQEYTFWPARRSAYKLDIEETRDMTA